MKPVLHFSHESILHGPRNLPSERNIEAINWLPFIPLRMLMWGPSTRVHKNIYKLYWSLIPPCTIIKQHWPYSRPIHTTVEICFCFWDQISTHYLKSGTRLVLWSLCLLIDENQLPVFQTYKRCKIWVLDFQALSRKLTCIHHLSLSRVQCKELPGIWTLLFPCVLSPVF